MIHDSTPLRLVAEGEGQQGYSEGVNDERKRIKGLLELVLGRLTKNKGKNWQGELERVIKECEHGHQQIPFESVI